MAQEFAALIEPVARFLLGEPNARMSSKHELRYGSRGSLAVDLRKGTWFDNEIGQGGGLLDLVTRETKLEGKERFDWLHEHGFDVSDDRHTNGHAEGKLGKIVETYDYTDETGLLLFQVVRFEPKDFRQRRPDREQPDGWSWGVRGVRQVPYRLPEIEEPLSLGRTVFIVEGERDVDNLRRHGVPATTNAGGAGKWKSELSEFFREADVVIIPDYDPQRRHPKTKELMFHPDGRPMLPGQDHAQDVAKALTGIAQHVRVLELWKFWPDMPLKGDVSDWLKAGGTIDALNALVDQLPDWSPTSPATTPEVFVLPLHPYVARPFCEIPKRQWLHAGHYVRGHVVMTIAPGGYGKSSLLLCNAIEMVIGKGLIGPAPIETVNVAYWNGEEPKKEEIELRIAALCTAHGLNAQDLNGKLFLGEKVNKDDWRFASTTRSGLFVPNERLIKTTIEYIRDNKIGCLMLDPMVNFHRVAEIDTGNMESLVKDVLYSIAEETNCCIEISHHTRKVSGGYEITVDDSRGAGAAANACRSARVMNRMSPQEAQAAGITVDLRTLYLRVHRDKQNMAPPGKAKWIKLANVHIDNDDFAQAVVAWDWPKEAVEIAVESKHYLRAEVGRNTYRFDPRASDWIGHEIGRHLGLKSRKVEGQNDERRKITAIVNALVAEKVFGIERLKTNDRKIREFMCVGEWKGEPEDLRQSEMFRD